MIAKLFYSHASPHLIPGERIQAHRLYSTPSYPSKSSIISQPTLLITGCSEGGLGDALAHAFAARHHRVFAAVRNRSKAAHFTDVANIEAVTLDVTPADSIRYLAAEIGPLLDDGRLDYLVNNAGVGATGPLLEADLDDARRIYEVNVLGPLAVTREFAPMLIKAGGTVINISSVGGLLVMPWGGLYHSSKAALTIFSETLRLELAPLGVDVVTAMLGSIESNFRINDAWRGLPESSHYKAIESHIAKTAVGEIGPKKEKAKDFARRLVADVLGGAKSQVWRGAMAQTTRVLGYHAPIKLLRLVGRTYLPNCQPFIESLTSCLSAQESQIKPACIDFLTAISVLVPANRLHGVGPARFVVRSGGHTSFAGSANVADGVTIDLQSLNTTKADESSLRVSIGTGAS